MNIDYPSVTIGIPTYNRSHKTLIQAISCACNQDYPNLEIVISDNCSTDNTEEVVSKIKDKRIKYIRQENNIGPNRNFNACLNAAKSDYFLLLHDDDLIDADFVSTCMKKAKYSRKYGVIRTGTRIININNETIKKEPNEVYSNCPDEMFSAWVNFRTSFYLCSTLVNTLAWKKIGGIKSKNNLFEDGFAIIKLSQNYPILNITEIKSSFRQHAEQRTYAAEALKWSEDFRIALDMIYLQDPKNRKEIYLKGMSQFTQISLRFALRVNNPFKRAFAVMKVGKYFPYYYWPNSPQVSLRSKIARTLSRIFFYDEKKELVKL